MRLGIDDITLTDNKPEVENPLSVAVETLKDIGKISIEEMKNDKAKEKKLIPLWVNHMRDIKSCLLEECERTGNKGFYKDIVKQMKLNK